MAWFKRKKEEELPPLPEVPELPPLKLLPALPPLPAVPREAPVQLPPPTEFEAPLAKVTPIFIRIDKYRQLLKTIKQIQDSLGKLVATLVRIERIKARETEIVRSWDTLMAETNTKMEEISAGLFQPEEE